MQQAYSSSGAKIFSTKKTFDILTNEFNSKGCSLISLEDYACLAQDGLGIPPRTRTKEAFIYLPGKVYLSKNSPILANPRQATNCHRKGLEFYLADDAVADALECAVEVRDGKIPVEYLDESDVARFAFGNHAEKFSEFLAKKGINEIAVWLCNTENRPFARQACVEYRPSQNLFILNSMNLNAEIYSVGIKSA